MKIILAKEEGLRIAISILNGEKTNKDYGSAALRESELILQNILETIQVEKEMLAKPPTITKKSNKKRALSPAQRKQKKVDLEAAKNYMGSWKNLTILEIEEGNK